MLPCNGLTSHSKCVASLCSVFYFSEQASDKHGLINDSIGKHYQDSHQEPSLLDKILSAAFKFNYVGLVS